jgi:hypothetical protein
VKVEKLSMPEPETYIFESDQGQRHSYEISAAGLTYRPPGRKSITVRWEDIRYLDDIPGLKVDIVLNDASTIIPLYYDTREFGALLTAVCSNLSGLHREKIGTQTFKGSLAYFVHSGLVLGVFLVLVLGSVFYLYRFTPVWLFVLTVTLPMAAYILLQPHTVVPGDDTLVVKDFVRTRFIDYTRIERVAFDFHGDRQAAFLCILVNLTNGRKIKMQRFENLILLFIFIQTKWHNARGKAAANVPPAQSGNYPSG